MRSAIFVLVLLTSQAAGAQPAALGEGDAGVAGSMSLHATVTLVSSMADDRCGGAVLAASRAAGGAVTFGTIDLGDGSSPPRYEPSPTDRLIERRTTGTREFRVTGLNGSWEALEMGTEGRVELACVIVDGDGRLRLSQSAGTDANGVHSVRRAFEVVAGTEHLRAETVQAERPDGGRLYDGRLSMSLTLGADPAASTLVTGEVAFRIEERPDGSTMSHRKRISHRTGVEELLLDARAEIATNARGRVTRVRGSGGFYRDGVRVGRVETSRGRDFAHVGIVFADTTFCLMRFPEQGEDVSALC
jgi:hypothetical protein